MRFVVVIWLCTGCSFAMTRPERVESEANPREVSCGDFLFPAVIDTAVAVTFIAATIGLAAKRDPDESVLVPASASAIVAAPFAASAVYGFSGTGKCRARARELANTSAPAAKPTTQTDEPANNNWGW